MRLIDADELMEHVGRDRLDSRELIAQMIENAPTVNINGCKPCPWCGGSPSLRAESLAKSRDRGYPGNFLYYVQCNKCLSTAPGGKWDDIYRSTEDAKKIAIEVWNKRYGE